MSQKALEKISRGMGEKRENVESKKRYVFRRTGLQWCKRGEGGGKEGGKRKEGNGGEGWGRDGS